MKSSIHYLAGLFTGAVPVNNEIFTGTVPANNEIFTGTVPVNNFFLILLICAPYTYVLVTIEFLAQKYVRLPSFNLISVFVTQLLSRDHLGIPGDE